jgi:hypothetical protein
MRFRPVLQQFVVGVMLQEQSERLGVGYGRGRLLLLFRRDPQQVFDGHVRRLCPGLLAAVLRRLLMVWLWHVVAVLAVCCRSSRRCCCRCRRRHHTQPRAGETTAPAECEISPYPHTLTHAYSYTLTYYTRRRVIL